MNKVKRTEISSKTKLLLMIAIISGSSLASALNPSKDGPLFTLDTEEAAHHFTPMGTLIPAAGHAHLSYFFNIT